MAGKTDFMETALLNWLFRAQAIGITGASAGAGTGVSHMYIGLLTSTKGSIARSTAYALNDTATFAAGDGTIHLYKATTAGTTASSAPSYPGTRNEVITDGTAVFTEQTTALEAGTAAVEPSGGNYARADVTSGTGTWAAPSGSTGVGKTISNSNIVTIGSGTPSAAWTVAGGAWGFGIYDALTSGNLLYWAPLAALKSISSGDAQPTFAAAALTITED